MYLPPSITMCAPIALGQEWSVVLLGQLHVFLPACQANLFYGCVAGAAQQVVVVVLALDAHLAIASVPTSVLLWPGTGSRRAPSTSAEA